MSGADAVVALVLVALVLEPALDVGLEVLPPLHAATQTETAIRTAKRETVFSTESATVSASRRSDYSCARWPTRVLRRHSR
jgi:hypothetical protein